MKLKRLLFLELSNFPSHSYHSGSHKITKLILGEGWSFCLCPDECHFVIPQYELIHLLCLSFCMRTYRDCLLDVCHSPLSVYPHPPFYSRFPLYDLLLSHALMICAHLKNLVDKEGINMCQSQFLSTLQLSLQSCLLSSWFITCSADPYCRTKGTGVIMLQADEVHNCELPRWAQARNEQIRMQTEWESSSSRASVFGTTFWSLWFMRVCVWMHVCLIWMD